MATLAQITRETRIILKILAVIVGTIFIVFLGTKTIGFVQRTFFPAPPPLPEEKFGKLPNILLPPNSTQDLQFRVNTISGNLPTFPDRIKVYTMQTPQPNLLALKTTREKLKNLGFTENETKLSETSYQWTNRNTGAKIAYNILSDTFEIKSIPTTSSATTQDTSLLEKTQLIKFISNFLSTLVMDISDINIDKTQVSHYRLVNGTLEPVDNVFSADAARVDLFQHNIDDLPIYYSTPAQSDLYFILIPSLTGLNVIEARFNHLVANKKESSTYPIKTAQASFEDLKKGKAYVFNGSSSKIIDITEVALGYYLGEKNQAFLLPIVVFKGKDFTAYVQAVP